MYSEKRQISRFFAILFLNEGKTQPHPLYFLEIISQLDFQPSSRFIIQVQYQYQLDSTYLIPKKNTPKIFMKSLPTSPFTFNSNHFTVI